MSGFRTFIEQLLGVMAARAETVIGPRSQVVGPRPSATVVPPPRFAWDEKKWRRVQDGSNTHYLGAYRVRDHRRGSWRSFDGRIVVGAGSDISAYCADPPPEIKAHRKGPCFMLVRPPWFRVHWHHAPASVDAAMLYVERLLDECLNDRRS